MREARLRPTLHGRRASLARARRSCPQDDFAIAQARCQHTAIGREREANIVNAPRARGGDGCRLDIPQSHGRIVRRGGDQPFPSGRHRRRAAPLKQGNSRGLSGLRCPSSEENQSSADNQVFAIVKRHATRQRNFRRQRANRVGGRFVRLHKPTSLLQARPASDHPARTPAR